MTQSLKMAEDSNSCFTKEDVQMARKYTKGCSTSQVIREMQIKTTTRHHRTSMILFKVKDQPWQMLSVEELELSTPLGGCKMA